METWNYKNPMVLISSMQLMESLQIPKQERQRFSFGKKLWNGNAQYSWIHSEDEVSAQILCDFLHCQVKAIQYILINLSR